MCANISAWRVGRLTRVLSIVGLAATAGVALAHHGDAGRFEEGTVTLSGTVVALQLINPHSSIILDIADASGKSVRWQAEFGSPAQLARNFGWNNKTLKAGDQITVTGRPLKSGQPYINLSERARILRTESCEEIYHSTSLPDEPPAGPACN